MAKTLEQLAGGSQAVPQVPTGVGVAPTVRPTKKIVGESLAQDLLDIIKPAAATVQAHNTASVKAAQRSAMDRKVDLATYIAGEEANITPDTDLRAVQERIQTAYLSLSNTTFDNEDAQNTFDEMFTRDTGLAVSQKNARFESLALKQDAAANRTANIAGISQQIIAAIPLTNTQVDTHIDSMTAGGYYTKEQSYGDVAYGMNTGLNEKYKINRNLPIYNPDGTVNAEMQMEEFNRTYGSVLTMDLAGALTPVGDITEKARQDIINNWKSLKVSHTAKTNTHNREYERMMGSGRRTQGNAQKTHTSSQELIDNINLLHTRQSEINSTLPLTEVQTTNYIKMIDGLKNELEESKIVESDVMNGDIDDIRTYLEDGKKVPEFYDVGLGKEKPRAIVADKYRSIVNKLQETSSSQLLQTNITRENQSQFNDQLGLLDRWEQISNTKSAFTKKYEDTFKSGAPSTLIDRREIKQALAFRNHKALTNPAYDQNVDVTNKMEVLLAKTKDGEPLGDLQIAMEANSILTVDKNTQQSKINSKALDQVVTQELENISTGEGALTRVFNANVAQGSSQALKKYISANGKGMNASQVVQDMEYLDYGTVTPAWFFGGSLDQRLLIPVNVDEHIFKNAIDQTINAYNRKHATKFDDDDVAFRSVYDKGTNNFLTEIYSKKDDREMIGTLDANSSYIISTKGE